MNKAKRNPRSRPPGDPLLLGEMIDRLRRRGKQWRDCAADAGLSQADAKRYQLEYINHQELEAREKDTKVPAVLGNIVDIVPATSETDLTVRSLVSPSLEVFKRIIDLGKVTQQAPILVIAYRVSRDVLMSEGLIVERAEIDHRHIFDMTDEELKRERDEILQRIRSAV